MITQSALKDLFDYKDGDLYWKISPSKQIKIGAKAGNTKSNGYLRVGINYKQYSLHRLIFMMHHGYVPDYIDHIDGDKANNRIENLRAASHSENLYNRKFQKNNTSGVKGVSYEKQYKKKWKAKISVDGKEMSIGRFETLEEAKKAIKATREKLHGFFANHG